jgi:hypothetical protein
MLTEKDLLNQDTFYKYGRGNSYLGEWYEGGFDCGLQVNESGDRVSFFLHNEVYGDKWFIRRLESLDDLKNLYEIIYPKKKFRLEKNHILEEENDVEN